MKKVLLTTAICLFSISAMALDCAYAPRQQIVRDAENWGEIEALGDKFDPNEKFLCGGTLSQLALLRGSLPSMSYLYERGADFSAMVPMAGYEIPGAPAEIPFPLFAARYSPNSQIIDVMLNSGIDFTVKDSAGHDVFWYFDKNPVLRHSYLTKRGWDSLKPTNQIVQEILDEDETGNEDEE